VFMRQKTLALGLVLGFAIVASAFYSRSPSNRRADSVARAAPPSEPEPIAQPTASEAPPALAPLVAGAAFDGRGPRDGQDTVVPDEEAIMARLSRLGENSPLESLALARRGNEYFPSGSGAPKRHWIIVKSLESLRRFHEARDEATSMVERYPADPLALDVKRHVLVYPLDMPSREEQQRNEPSPRNDR
jgi:hypothetical protein